MKLLKALLLSSALFVSVNASDVMQKSMAVMFEGMNEIQAGFLNNQLDMIESGIKKVEEGNNLFSDKDTIVKYLPENKKHLSNVAINASQRLSVDIADLKNNLEQKAYINAANSYSDMINACAKCHSTVRSW